MFAQYGPAVFAGGVGRALSAAGSPLDEVDGYRDYIAGRVRAALPAKVLLGEIRERGYCGGYTMVKAYVASLRKMVVAEVPQDRLELEQTGLDLRKMIG